MLTQEQITKIRYYMGYQNVGNYDITEQNDIVYGWFGVQVMSLYKRLNTLLPSEETFILDLLSKCISLETALFNSSDNLDTAEAAVWKHNKQEISDRNKLLKMYRKKICEFLGFPYGNGLSNSNTTRLNRV